VITGTIVGDRTLIERLGKMPPAVTSEVDAAVQKLGFELQARVQGSKLTGQVLHVRTGRLRSSLAQGASDTRSRFESTTDAAIAYVGTNVSYGVAWELGFSRRVGAGARGGPRTLTGKSLQTYIARHPPGVRQYAARPYLAPALFEMRAQITQELGVALKRGMEAALRS